MSNLTGVGRDELLERIAKLEAEIKEATSVCGEEYIVKEACSCRDPRNGHVSTCPMSRTSEAPICPRCEKLGCPAAKDWGNYCEADAQPPNEAPSQRAKFRQCPDCKGYCDCFTEPRPTNPRIDESPSYERRVWNIVEAWMVRNGMTDLPGTTSHYNLTNQIVAVAQRTETAEKKP